MDKLPHDAAAAGGSPALGSPGCEGSASPAKALGSGVHGAVYIYYLQAQDGACSVSQASYFGMSQATDL